MSRYNFLQLKVCFVGVGSIASKHIVNLREICEAENISLSIDALRRKSPDAKEIYEAAKFIDNVYHEADELPDDYDVIFITNPTKLHVNTLIKVKEKAEFFFVEKPVSTFEQLEEAEKFADSVESCKYYVACPLRYTDVIEYLSENVKEDEVVAVRSICSSYLPEWRPGTDYRQCYSANKSLGGGVAVDLIHEWDYLTFLFGFPQRVQSMFTKKSSLEMDVEDCALYLAEYENMTMELHLDYYGRKSIREVQIFTGEDTIVGDFINNRVAYLKDGKVLEFAGTGKDVSKRELLHFLDIISGKVDNDNNIENSIEVLRLTKS